MAKVFLIFADLSALGYFSLMVYVEETVVRSAKRFAEETVGRFVGETVVRSAKRFADETAVRSGWRFAEGR